MTPNFFLVGTTKGGTSSLDMWLRGHPEVATPRRKELHYFCSCPKPHLRAADTLEEYLGLFPANRAVGESSPCYLYYPDVPEQLASFPGVRIIVSLRDPAERFWSHYLMNEAYRPTGLEPMELLEQNLSAGRTNAIEDLFGVGLYGEQIHRYRKHFEADRILVMFLEETASDADRAMRRLLDFLNLTPLTLRTSSREKQYVEPRGALGRLMLRNPAMLRLGNLLLPGPARRILKTRVLGDPDAKPQLPGEVRQRLQSLYAADSRELESILGRPLPWTWHR